MRLITINNKPHGRPRGGFALNMLRPLGWFDGSERLSLGREIAASFVEKMGVVYTADFGPRPAYYFGYKLQVLSDIHRRPKIVQLTLPSSMAMLLEDRQPGELMRLSTRLCETGQHRWHRLVVNGEEPKMDDKETILRRYGL